MNDLERAIQAWRRADLAARTAETLLVDAFMQYGARHGPRPLPIWERDAALRRAEASRLLQGCCQVVERIRTNESVADFGDTIPSGFGDIPATPLEDRSLPAAMRGRNVLAIADYKDTIPSTAGDLAAPSR